MKRLFRSSVLVPLGLALILALAFLTGRKAKTDSAGRPVVVYAHPPCPPELMAIYNPIFEEFRRTHPDINLEVLHITGSYEDKLKVMFAGNVAPDVVFMYPWALPAWVELGALEPLDPYLQDRNAYFPVMLDTFSYKGRLYGLPKDASAPIMYYNKDMFKKYGVSPPRPDWTWDDMLAAAKTLTRDTDGDGRIDQWGMSAYEWAMFVWQSGGNILDDSGQRCALLEPAASEGLEFWAALRSKYGVTPTLEASADLGDTRLFSIGKVGMYFAMYPAVSILRKTCEFDWDCAPVPRGPKARATMVQASALAVTTQSRNKAAAYEYVRWLTSPAGMKFLVSVESPSCVELARSPAFLESPDRPASKHVAVEAMQYAHPPLQHPFYAEINDALWPELFKAWRGDLSVRQAMEAAEPKVNQILARRKHP